MVILINTLREATYLNKLNYQDPEIQISKFLNMDRLGISNKIHFWRVSQIIATMACVLYVTENVKIRVLVLSVLGLTSKCYNCFKLRQRFLDCQE